MPDLPRSPLAGPVVGSDEIKVALIGCGARAAGAAAQALSTAGRVKLWAMADAFEDRLEHCLENLKRGLSRSYDREDTASLADRIDVPPERRFVGLDAYQKAIDSDVHLVVHCAPPGFRPQHFAAAIAAGKHVFMEKPVATEVAGVHQVLKTAAEASQKNLKVGVGLQRRHEPSYNEVVAKLHDGAIGEIPILRCYWNGGAPAKTPVLREDLTELEYQVRNWYFFTWLSGDHICEQHVHNLDVCNWVKNAVPVSAQGMGGRQVRTGDEYGHIFDHHAVEFTYPDGAKMFSQCRQIPGCWSYVSEAVHGVKGSAELGRRATIEARGERPWRWRLPRGQRAASPYQTEFDALVQAIREDEAYNEAQYGATSTMTAILGRMATYSGKTVTWEEAMAGGDRLTADVANWSDPAPVSAASGEKYPVAIPGVTEML